MKTCKILGKVKIYREQLANYYFITVTSEAQGESSPKDLSIIFDEIASYCKEYKLIIVHERIFGSESMHMLITDIRKESYEKNGIDCRSSFTYVNAVCVKNEGLAGVHIQAISTDKYNISSINGLDGNIVGIKWSNPDCDFLSLHSVHSNNFDASLYDQTKEVFYNISKLLGREGINFKNVCRTWIYLDHILSQYDDFNKGRNEVFKEFGLITSMDSESDYEKINLPASTGIEGGNIYGASCIIDVSVIKPKTDKINIYNESGVLQNSAFRYGSAFSRSMVVEDKTNNTKLLYLSGTASINKTGDSVFIDDIQGQIKTTFDTIDKLLKNNNLTLSNICEGTVFLKSPILP